MASSVCVCFRGSGACCPSQYRWNILRNIRSAIDQNEGGLEKFSRGESSYPAPVGTSNVGTLQPCSTNSSSYPSEPLVGSFSSSNYQQPYCSSRLRSHTSEWYLQDVCQRHFPEAACFTMDVISSFWATAINSGIQTVEAVLQPQDVSLLLMCGPCCKCACVLQFIPTTLLQIQMASMYRRTLFACTSRLGDLRFQSWRVQWEEGHLVQVRAV
jgi:hypothetical protein